MNNKAIDVVIGELDKLAMCKRGTIATEEKARMVLVEKEFYPGKRPYLSKKELKKNFKKNKEELFALLVFMPPKGFCSDYRENDEFFTEESIEKFDERWKELSIPPQLAEWKEKKQTLAEQNKKLMLESNARVSVLDADFQSAKMNFISGKVSLKDFEGVFNKLEQKEW